MPNHYHLLVRQVVKGGISKYMGDFQNSYSKYFNTRNERKGSLFLRPFRAVRVESDEGLLHLSRYIHLNPVTGYLVRDIDNLAAYKWSSWTEYTNKKLNLCNPSEVLSFFGGSSAKYKRFVINQADYQRKLKKIEYLIKVHQ